jgi:hypothetical protein
MGKWIQWLILTSLTGSPLLSILILLVVWYAADRFTLRILPNPVRLFMRWQRGQRLEAGLIANPHDRRSRLELADIRVEQRRYKAAVDILRPNLEAGDDDAGTLLLMGTALYGAGHYEQAEKVLGALVEHTPNFRQGAAFLELGKFRAARGEYPRAQEAFATLVKHREGTVEGRVRWAAVMDRLGDSNAAATLRQDAWREYLGSPGFQKRRERLWAWRANPSRPLTYAAVLLVLGLLFGRFVAPGLADWAEQTRHSDDFADMPQE